jgi:hypothetical protein
VFLIVAALLPGSGATAATLQLAGPAGASVTLNGRAIGFLPLAEPLTLPAGTWELLCEMPGRIPHRQTLVFVTDDEWLHVTALLEPYRRSTAVWSNVLLAGLGSHYLGHSTRGWFYSIVEVGGLVTALGAEIARSDANDEYLLAMDAYSQAIDAEEIAIQAEAAEGYQQEAADAAELRDLCLVAAAGAIVVSMLDSWLSFGSVAAGAGDFPSDSGTGHSMGPSASPSFHSALRLEF